MTTPPNKSLQATRDGAFSSASRFTLFGPACLSSERWPLLAKVQSISLTLVVTILMVGCGSQHNNEARVNKAILAAQGSLTNFIVALQAQRSNQMAFKVLAAFPPKPPYYSQAVWANVWKYKNGVFWAVVAEDNARAWLTNNQRVNIASSNVVDWMYLDFGSGGGIVGNFIERAALEGANPQGGANGRQPFSSETNRTSAPAASRRSP
jgi:uncharacterized protein YegJ (DUF2314 family)